LILGPHVVMMTFIMATVPHPEHHHHHKTPGEPMPIQQGVLASPSPSPTPTTYPSGVLSAEQVAGYAREAGFEESLIDDMVAIAFRESRFNPHAVNSSSGACGLWQLYPCPGSSAFDPQANAWYAREKCLASVAAGSSCLRPWGG
jgi:Soluble lytic murein transglycosylase and related regulatory proteins (some contain LysM/invasin domains)